MNRSDVQTKLQEIRARLLYSDSDLEMDELFRDQGYDSLDQVEFFMEAEKEFGLALPDSKLSNIKTPDQLVELIILHTHLTDGPQEAIAPI